MTTMTDDEFEETHQSGDRSRDPKLRRCHCMYPAPHGVGPEVR